MKLYLNTKKYEDVLAKLGELQAKNPIKTSTEEKVRVNRGGQKSLTILLSPLEAQCPN